MATIPDDTFSLGEKQRLFAKLVPRLIDHAHELGFEVTLGDAFRDPRAFGPHGSSRIALTGHSAPYGNPVSCHKLKLAIDLNLFKGGEYLPDTLDHLPLGEWWEKLHPLCRWGGRFQDGNHYSFIHQGAR